MLLGAADPRIGCTVQVGYFTTSEDMILNVSYTRFDGSAACCSHTVVCNTSLPDPVLAAAGTCVIAGNR
jgi:hypothetical protein